MRAFCRRVGASLSVETSRRGTRDDIRLQIEWLERRELMTATATPQVEALAVSGVYAFNGTPAEIRAAYGFSNVTFKNGAAGTGAGETIAIVDAYGDSHIASDLAAFDAEFHLAPPPSLKVVNENGGTALPANNAGWDMEISLDVEWAHVIAPGASILLVEASTAGLGDLLNAVNYARNAPGVAVVSMSWGAGEFQGENYYDSYFTTPAGHQGVTFVGSSGDAGAPGLWPAMSPNVLAVGGTTLDVTAAGAYGSESAWSDSGGGISPYETEPAYQRSVQTKGMRTGPDVAYDANPSTGFYVYDSVSSGWYMVGGTSAGAPQWAGLVAVADQGRALAGLGTLNGVNAQLYALPSTDFHDITSGNNGYAATAGYDLVTGRGSPVANLVIAGLVSSSVTTAVIGPLPLASSSAAAKNNDVSAGGGDGSENSAGAVTPAAPMSLQLAGYNPLVNGTNPTAALATGTQSTSWQTAGVPLANLVTSTVVRASGAGKVDAAASDQGAALLPALPATLAPATVSHATRAAAHDAALGAAAADILSGELNLGPSDSQPTTPVEGLEAIWFDADFSDADSLDAPAVSAPGTPVTDPTGSQAAVWMTAVVGLAVGCTQSAAAERGREAGRPAMQRTWPPRVSRN